MVVAVMVERVERPALYVLAIVGVQVASWREDMFRGKYQGVVCKRQELSGLSRYLPRGAARSGV